MWPQPPQPLSEPSGLMSLQLEPVPEMSTIPPGKGTGGSAWLTLHRAYSFQLRKGRTETSPKQMDHHPALGRKPSPASFLPEGGGPGSQKNSSHTETFSKEEPESVSPCPASLQMTTCFTESLPCARGCVRPCSHSATHSRL